MSRTQAELSAPESGSESKTIESRALFFGGAVLLVTTLVGLFIFWGESVPIFGLPSIGSISSIFAAVMGYSAFIIAYHHPHGQISKRRLARFRWWLKVAALAFAHAAIFFLFTILAFFVIQHAFEGLMLDQWSSAVIVGVVSGLASYCTYLMGARLTSRGVSMVLALFLLSGTLVSMITTDNPQWWMSHFSSLGGGSTLSAYAFNVTLIIGGIVIAALADLIANDFAILQAKSRPEYTNVRVHVIRAMLAAIGLMLAGVGIFVWNVYPIIHNVSASGMVLLFIILICMLPKLAPDFPRAFFVFSFSIIAAIVACYWLWTGVGYLNLTAVELLCAGIVFGWIVVFVRHISAGLEDNVGEF